MTPEEIELWRYAIDEITSAWIIGSILLMCGIGLVSVKIIVTKDER